MSDDTNTIAVEGLVRLEKYHDGRTPDDGEPDEVIEFTDTFHLTAAQIAALKQQAGDARQEDEQTWP